MASDKPTRTGTSGASIDLTGDKDSVIVERDDASMEQTLQVHVSTSV